MFFFINRLCRFAKKRFLKTVIAGKGLVYLIINKYLLKKGII